ncbi:MAG: class I SAM-dependent methyltransferase [Dehalococcoidia bacterium]
MSEEYYDHQHLVDLYDVLCPWDVDNDFYMAAVEPAHAPVLDLGCGTGLLAAAFARVGHAVSGVDASGLMLGIARTRAGGAAVDWVHADARTVRLGRRFDRIICTGHAFQVFLTEPDQLAFLQTAAAHLAPDGRFIVETRNPAATAWRTGTPAQSLRRVPHPVHGAVEVFSDAADPVDGVVHVTTTYRFLDRAQQYVSAGRLRCSDLDEVHGLLARSGRTAAAVYGDGDTSPLTTTSREIIAICRLGRARHGDE